MMGLDGGTTAPGDGRGGKAMVQLNIGASETFLPGFINIDIVSEADLRLDINVKALPFEDNSVDLVFTHHTLEHIPNYLFALGEIHRVLRHEGLLLAGLPYTSLSLHQVNPYHHHNFSEDSFSFFELGRRKGSAAEENAILFQEVFVRLNYMGLWSRLPKRLQEWCRHHFLNVVWDVDFGLLAIKREGERVPVSRERAARCVALYDKLLASRVRRHPPEKGTTPPAPLVLHSRQAGHQG